MADRGMSNLHIQFRRGSDGISPPVLLERGQGEAGSFEKRLGRNVHGVTHTARARQRHAARLKRHPLDSLTSSRFIRLAVARRITSYISATLLLAGWCVADRDLIDVRCGGCGNPMRLTIEELRDKFTVNCPACAGRSHPSNSSAASSCFPRPQISADDQSQKHLRRIRRQARMPALRVGAERRGLTPGSTKRHSR